MLFHIKLIAHCFMKNMELKNKIRMDIYLPQFDQKLELVVGF